MTVCNHERKVVDAAATAAEGRTAYANEGRGLDTSHEKGGGKEEGRGEGEG